MLAIPELETIFILVPRTGTSTIISEMTRVYPKATLIYRHMEADGTPPQFAGWKKIGFVRHPVARLWSIFKMLSLHGHGDNSADFEDWLRYNDAPLMLGNNSDHLWAQKSRLPENRRSQFSYLRPDLQTEVIKFESLRCILTKYRLNSETVRNASEPVKLESLTNGARKLIEKYCAWDLEQECAYV